jgi:hypothetical protein
MNIAECQVLMQDIALEVARLDRRLGKMSVPSIAVGQESLEAQLAVRIQRPRRSLQEITLLLLELAQMSGQARLRREDGEDLP